MRRTVSIILFVLAVCTIFIITFVANPQRGVGAESLHHEKAKTPNHAPRKQQPDLPGTINGALNPELIPDNAAYSILFRMLIDRNTENEKDRARAYLRQVLKCSQCKKTTENDSDINALLATATEFEQKVGPLDREAARIKDQNWPNPGPLAMSKLELLQRRKEAVVAGLIASLLSRLNIDGLIKVRAHVEGMKRQMKIAPGPKTPPGGEGWRERAPHHH